MALKNISNQFILAGNGYYENRGCEAITRGTTKILRTYFDDPSFIAVSNFQSEEQFNKQCIEEHDRKITHKKIFHTVDRFTFDWIKSNVYRRVHPAKDRELIYREMLPYLDDSKAVLSLGGDNYSLDYGLPKLFTDLDDLVLSRKKPMFIWGASVGPFRKDKAYEKYMSKHLQSITGIFVREPESLEYLDSIGVKNNVFPVADPAFMMQPTKPQHIPFGENPKALGINLSELMCRYLCEGNLEQWILLSKKLLENIAVNFLDHEIYLIPHVVSPNGGDHTFMSKVLSIVDDKLKHRFHLVGQEYNASELKWIISNFECFVGARTHSTIAAFSTYVPTVSLAYSIKAIGINKDIFGSNYKTFCIEPESFEVTYVIESIKYCLENQSNITQLLEQKMVKMKEQSLKAGEILQELLR